jgi:hypothetical protein
METGAITEISKHVDSVDVGGLARLVQNIQSERPNLARNAPACVGIVVHFSHHCWWRPHCPLADM